MAATTPNSTSTESRRKPPAWTQFCVAVYQGDSVPGQVSANVQRVCRVAQAARTRGADLVMFPEVFLSGYDIGPAALRACAVSQRSDAFQRLQAAARETGIALCVPYAERDAEDEQRVFNSVALIDATGAVVLNHRKVQLWHAGYEDAAFTPGDPVTQGFRVATLQPHGIRVGLLVCYESEFPEPARVLGLKGAELICISTALAASESNHVIPRCVVPARAMENAVYVAYSNFRSVQRPVAMTKEEEEARGQYAITFCGLSAIVGPDGRDLSRATDTQEGLLVADLSGRSLFDFYRRNPYFHDRIPAAYGGL